MSTLETVTIKSGEKVIVKIILISETGNSISSESTAAEDTEIKIIAFSDTEQNSTRTKLNDPYGMYDNGGGPSH